MQVLRLPMSFFDSQPAGRLLNRFSQDTESTDVVVRETIAWCLTCVGESQSLRLCCHRRRCSCCSCCPPPSTASPT